MPAEMTGSYDERTRLMGWRIVFLALTILVTGAGAPLVRDAVGGRDGYRVMGVVVALRDRVGVVAVYVGTRSAPIGAAQAAHGGLRDQLRVVAARPRLPAAAARLRRAGPRRRLHARRGRLPRLRRARAPGRLDVAVRRLRRPGAAADAGLDLVGERVGKKAGYVASSVIFAVGAFGVVLARTESLVLVLVAVTLVGVGYAGCQVFPLAMLPDVAGARRPPHRREPGRRLHRRVDRRRDARPRDRAGPVRPRAGARRVRVEHRRRRRPGRRRLLAITLGCSVVPAVLTAAEPVVAAALHADLRRGGGSTHERRLATAGRDAEGRPAGHRRPEPGLRVRRRAARGRAGRTRGGGGLRRLERPRPDGVPEPAADGERARRVRRRAARRPGRRGRLGHLRRHRVGAARRPDRPRRTPGRRAAAHGDPVDGAPGLPQGGALLRRRGGAGAGRTRLPRRRRRHAGR